jgi:polysaccharide transporter, PST family
MLKSKILLLKNNKNILNNIFSLLVLQGSKYIIPIILLPYLVRNLGIEAFGLLAFITATINILRGIVSYGFDFSGTKQISLERDNKEKISEIYSSIIFAKLFISIISFLILCLMYCFFDKVQENFVIFLFGFLIIFGEAIFPTWFFQGVEKMKIITYLTIIYKVIFMVLVILMVKNAEDLYLVLLLDSIGSILIGIYSLYFVKSHYKIIIHIPTLNQVYFQLKNGWHIFLSRITVILYSTFNTFLLGVLASNEIVGFYSIAEKIYMAIRGLFNPLVQAFFPFLAKKFKENKIAYFKIVKKLLIAVSFLLFIFSITTYYFSNDIIFLVSGKYINESKNILEIFSISIFFALGSFFSIFLIIKEEEKQLSKITFISMFVNLILIYPAIYFFSIKGLVFLFLFIQIIQTILQIKFNKELFKNEN